MINSLKTVAVFGCSFTGRYKQELCRLFNTAAEHLRVNLVYFNSLGKIGNKNAQYGDYEFDLIESVDLEQFDGIIFDGDNYNVDGMADKVIRKLRTAKCPVVSISSVVDGFYNIEFNDADAIKILTEHFIEVHGATRIGFMSGYLSHPDAQARLKAFRSVMKAHGMHEDGAGVFEGDFWFGKGEEAADFFLSQPERPQAIVCANDYMAISLANALKARGVRVPRDIAVSGFDGTVEGQECLPHITTGTRERYNIAVKALSLIIDISEGREPDLDLKIDPKIIYSQSCGCEILDYMREAENINHVYESSRGLSYTIYDVESFLLMLNKVNSMEGLEDAFLKNSQNFGIFRSYFLMIHTDKNGNPAYDSDFIEPTGNFRAVIAIDKYEEYQLENKTFSVSELLPASNSERPHVFYVMSTHCSERMFGYSVIEMSGKGIYSESFNVWLLSMSMTLETMLKSDKIRKLVRRLEAQSTHDELTGMLNRRGFDELSRDAIRSINGRSTICTIVIDMDGLKPINDDYGHHEGDRAIRTAADIITECCRSGEIAGRAGGDEFFIFAPDYSEEKLRGFIERLRDLIDERNSDGKRPYRIELSWGAYICETDSSGRLEDMLKESDALMYEQKHSKPNRRK